MSKQIAALMIQISADAAEAMRTLQSVDRQVKSFGKKMQDYGSTLTKFVTGPLALLGTMSVKAANTQLQAEARLLTALQGREDVQRRLIEQAAELQSRTLYGDETIIEQQAFLASLGLTEQQIGATIEAAAQLSAALGMEFEGAVRNLSKTFGGLTGELGESIPALKGLTAEQLRAGAAIDFVNENYQGFAETAAETGAGPLLQLKNRFGDVAERIGVTLTPALESLVALLDRLATWLEGIDDSTLKWVVAIGGAAAAIGPLLSGVGSLIVQLPKIASAFSAMLGPIGLVVSALAAVVAGFISANAAAERFEQNRRSANDAARSGIYNEYSRSIYSNADIEQKISELQALRNSTIQFAVVGGIDRTFEIQNLESQILGLQDVLAARQRAIEDSSVAQASYNEEVAVSVGLLGSLREELQTLEDSRPFATALEDIAAINVQADKLRQQISEIEAYSGAGVVKQVSGITVGGVDLSSLTAGPTVAAGTPLKSPMQELLLWWQDQEVTAQEVTAVVAAISNALSNSMAELATSIGEGIGNLINGEETFDPLQRLLDVIGDMLKALGSALIAYATALEAFKKAFANPWVALAAGVAAVAAGTVIKNIAKEPIKLATGGLAYGPTLAVVGDNPGATSDPEVVAPLSKLRSYMGSQRMELVGDITFELSGESLRAVLNRENVRLSTLR